MVDDSSLALVDAPGSSASAKGDKVDEFDANIRNFAPVARIMKNALPDNAKIAKEAKECMQECVSEFISFITSEGKSSLKIDAVVYQLSWDALAVSDPRQPIMSWRLHRLAVC